VSEIPNDRHYSAEHEWALERDGVIVVGITHFAQDQLGDVVFVELPEPGTTVTAGQTMGEVESTKSVSDVYSPVSGKVTSRNEEVISNPELINSDPYQAGWLVQIEAEGSVLDGLLTPEQYSSHVESQR
jgi:glycine cleavage system H protein